MIVLSFMSLQAVMLRIGHTLGILGKISQFEFLVMTEKNIFAYKLFLSLNNSDFNLFFLCGNCNPPSPLKKVTPL